MKHNAFLNTLTNICNKKHKQTLSNCRGAWKTFGDTTENIQIFNKKLDFHPIRLIILWYSEKEFRMVFALKNSTYKDQFLFLLRNVGERSWGILDPCIGEWSRLLGFVQLYCWVRGGSHSDRLWGGYVISPRNVCWDGFEGYWENNRFI